MIRQPRIESGASESRPGDLLGQALFGLSQLQADIRHLIDMAGHVGIGESRSAWRHWRRQAEKPELTRVQRATGPKQMSVMSSTCVCPAENSRMSCKIARPIVSGPPEVSANFRSSRRLSRDS